MTDKEALYFRNRIRELQDSCFQRSIPTHSRFLNADEQAVLQGMHPGSSAVRAVLTGGFPDAERRIVCFLPEYLQKPPEDLLCCLKIAPVSLKFAEELTHRDYLGALMNLGIGRESMGDISVEEDCAYLVMLPALSETVIEGLTEVRRTRVTVTRIPMSEASLKRRTVLQSVNTASCRADAMLSAVFNISRSGAKELFKSGRVFVNACELLDSSRLLKPGDIMSVRGKGRFRFLGESRQTRKGRMYVDIERFV